MAAPHVKCTNWQNEILYSLMFFSPGLPVELSWLLTITIGLGAFLIVLLSIFHFEDIPKFKIMVKNVKNGNNGEKDHFLKMHAGGDEKLIYNK